MANLILCGISGRMGQRMADLVQHFPKLQLLAGIERAGSAAIGKAAGKLGVVDNLASIIDQSDVLIDFTHPESTLKHLELCVKHQKALVIGTTGFSESERKKILEAAQKISVVFSSNMSVGVNVMWKIIAEATKALGPSYDIEVLEMHHRLKKDAPSGTAMTTAEVLAEASGRNLSKDAIYARQGMIGERKANEIGIQTLRGGDVVGDHTVYFAGIGERLEITHRATSRDTFAQGALRAAEWLIGKKPGLYSMQDVLGLNNEKSS